MLQRGGNSGSLAFAMRGGPTLGYHVEFVQCTVGDASQNFAKKKRKRKRKRKRRAWMIGPLCLIWFLW